MNVWLSAKGTRPDKYSLPYTANHPVTNEKILIQSKKDIEKTLLEAKNYIESENAELGYSLWRYLPYFVNDSDILDIECQDSIRKYEYSRMTGTPPYPSIADTPDDLIEAFFTIKNELESVSKHGNS